MYAVEPFPDWFKVSSAVDQFGLAPNEALPGPIKKPDVEELGPSPELPLEGFK